MAGTTPDEGTVHDNVQAHQYEVRIGSHTAVLVYEREGDQLLLRHTSVPDELEGHGIGGKLARAALEDARSRGLIVIPNCPFVASYIRRHPDYLAIVAENRRHELERPQ